VPAVAFTVTEKPPVMVCANTSELALAVLRLSPEYFAVMAWVPTLRVEVVNEATPSVGVTALPIAVLPSKKVTVPLGLLLDWIVASKVTLDPEATLVLEELIASVVGLALLPPQPATPPTILRVRSKTESG